MKTLHPTNPPKRPPTSRIVVWSALAVVLWVAGRTAWRLQESVGLTRRSEPLQTSPALPALRLLIVGDSTAVGTGASGPQASVAGRLAQAFPGLRIDNRARDGATLAQLLPQLEGSGRVDMVWCG